MPLLFVFAARSFSSPFLLPPLLLALYGFLAILVNTIIGASDAFPCDFVRIYSLDIALWYTADILLLPVTMLPCAVPWRSSNASLFATIGSGESESSYTARTHTKGRIFGALHG